MIRSMFLLLAVLPMTLRADDPPKFDDALRQELLKRVKADQDARQAMIELMQKGQKPGSPPPAEFKLVEEIDTANTQRLKEIVAKRGWPGVSLVGKDGASAAWLLVQHADRDREFQKKCLGLMKELLPKGEVSKPNFAYLTDRVLVAEKKQQLYGTQFHTVAGKLVPQPIEDEAKVDARRKEMGLGTLEEYRAQMEKMYGPRKK